MKTEGMMEVNLLMNTLDMGEHVVAYSSATNPTTGEHIGNRYAGSISRGLLIDANAYKQWLTLMENMTVAALRAGGGQLTTTPIGEQNG